MTKTEPSAFSKKDESLYQKPWALSPIAKNYSPTILEPLQDHNLSSNPIVEAKGNEYLSSPTKQQLSILKTNQINHQTHEGTKSKISIINYSINTFQRAIIISPSTTKYEMSAHSKKN